MKLTNIAACTALLFAAVTGTYAVPQSDPVQVGLAERCGDIDGKTYVCVPNQGLTCAAMPNTTQTICLKTAQNGEACNKQFTRCAADLTCEIPDGQWAGVCRPTTKPTSSPPEPITVGLAERCGDIDGKKYVCVPNQGLTCAAMPNTTQTICLKTAQVGEACNNQFTRCAEGAHCQIPSGQWAGTCVRN
ncbi:hypothetical protein THASP1DRAFT_32832 [Thamnocephalis sphaerospora]|uniref:Uncharacterized protein n=1 Tax=Thamnocephalis sphaerospora TaxID=78915 RepID=A0A4P9XI41_9FUNG|nr:hypothetical protein THASP1DRAFT_32832 [Thamnocephalis sphaerospora]|eukprot:RKP05326.1 hypothetical protein THASP1DRAFT_32832 [Thamnocephalis sphaerospora]